MFFEQPKPFTNQADVDAYINHDKIQCLICGNRYQFLPTHITRVHQTSADDYRQLFNINAGSPLAGLTYRQKQREKIERLQREGRLTYEHLGRASDAARDADRNKTDYQRKQQSDLVRAVKPHAVNQLAPGSKRADGRDADHARLYQRKYRYKPKSRMSRSDWLALDWNMTNHEIVDMVDKTLSLVQTMRSRLNIGIKSTSVKNAKQKWEAVDWTRDNHEIARELGVALATVEVQRSLNRGGRAKSKSQKMWESVDWSKSNQQLADEMGYTYGTVAYMRYNMKK